MTHYRTDDWQNLLTGLGIADTTSGARHRARAPISRIEIDSLYRQSGLIRKIINKLPDDAMRKGFTLRVEGQDSSGEPLDDKAVTRKVEAYKLSRAVQIAGRWSRLYGGAVVTIPAIDGRLAEDPLDLRNVQSLFFPCAIGAYEATVDSYDHQFGSESFRQPLTYLLQTPDGVISTHASRVCPIAEVELPYETLQYDSNYTGWGPGLVETVYDDLARYGTAQRHAAAMLNIASILILKMKNYRSVIQTSGGKDQMREILKTVMGNLSSLALQGLDTEDALEVLSLPLSGLPEILDRFERIFVAVAGLPKEILMNESPAGLNAGQLSGPQQLHFAEVQAYRKTRLEPVILRWAEVAFAHWGYEIESLQVEWPDLWAPSESDEATTLFTRAQADRVYVEIGAATSEEIREHRFVQQRTEGLIVSDEPRETGEDIAAEAAPAQAPADLATPEELEVPLETIHRMYRRGEIGGWWVDGRWRFSRAQVQAQVQAQAGDHGE